MSDLLDEALDVLRTLNAEHRETDVIYRRTNGDSFALTAVRGKTTFRVDTGTGFFEEVESRDWIVAPEDLLFGCEEILPERGDKILLEQEDGTYLVFEVTSPSGESHYRWCDSYRKAMRIHTQEIETEIPT